MVMSGITYYLIRFYEDSFNESFIRFRESPHPFPQQCKSRARFWSITFKYSTASRVNLTDPR